MSGRVLTTRSHGFVLVVVLGMIMMLAVLLFGFNWRSRTHLNVADAFRKSEQARNCALAGLNIALAAVRGHHDICTDSRYADLLTGRNSFAVGRGTCSIAVVEENGKLNVNLLKDKDGQLSRMRVDQFLQLIDVLNRRFGTNFKPADQLFVDQVREEAADREEVRQAAQANTLDGFGYVFDPALESIIIERMEQNEEIFARFMDDPDFRRVVAERLRREVYDQIREEVAKSPGDTSA